MANKLAGSPGISQYLINNFKSLKVLFGEQKKKEP